MFFKYFFTLAGKKKIKMVLTLAITLDTGVDLTLVATRDKYMVEIHDRVSEAII